MTTYTGLDIETTLRVLDRDGFPIDLPVTVTVLDYGSDGYEIMEVSMRIRRKMPGFEAVEASLTLWPIESKIQSMMEEA